MSKWYYPLLLLLLVGCSKQRQLSTPISSVDGRKASYAMRTIQLNEEGRRAMKGSGESMAPIYGDNTLMVIQPISYYDLKPGMMVAYWSHSGMRIVHELIEKEGEKWVAKGLNNEFPDPEWVTAENFIGVVYATFLSK